MTKTSEDERLVGSDRVLAVLVELADHPTGVTLDEMAHRLNSSKSTIHRALMSLRRAGLAHQLARGVYVLGDEFIRLAFRNHAARPEGLRIEPALQELASRYGETAHYAVLDGNEVIYRAKVDPPHGSVRLTSEVGGRNPANFTAVGKMLLSLEVESAAELRQRLGTDHFPPRTERSITTIHALWDELQLTKERGYAVDDQENEVGINCVALPVHLDPTLRAIGAISVSALVFRLPLQRLVDEVPTIRQIIGGTLPLESVGQ